MNFQASGTWSPLEIHPISLVNCQQLLAVTRAVQTDAALRRGKRVLVASDNTTMVAYINHQGGTRSMTFMDFAFDLFSACRSGPRCRCIRARHVPDKLSRTADLPSPSHQIVNAEWTLKPEVAHALWKV